MEQSSIRTPEVAPRSTPLVRAAARLALGLLILTGARPPEAVGQTERDAPFVIARLSGPIDLDGRVSEEAWLAVEPIRGTLHLPTFGGTPTEETEFRFGHDGRHLYLSCRALDSESEGIRTTSLQRDESSFSTDWCIFGLDTFLDRETSLTFGVTPTGSRSDASFSNDAQGTPNFSWNTFWDAAAHRDGTGWSAEVRIPLTSLRFQEGPDGVHMGLSALRLIARKNEFQTFPAISPEWGTLSPFKASQMREVVLRGARGGNPLYVTPYALAGSSYGHTLDTTVPTYVRDEDDVREVGGDVKYGLTENLTLDVTVNTDFAQVEDDNQQVNLTRFSLFFPEKRPFFQERANVFETSLGGNERLFHSRRIGLSDGRPLRIYGGARVVGRIGEWDLGLLDLQTEAPTAGGDAENTGVLRVRRRALNDNSYVGGIVTTRLGNATTENQLYGVDALLRLFGQDYLSLAWSQSRSPGNGGDFLGSAYGRFFWERRGVDGLTYTLDLSRGGAAYEPGLGFLIRRGYEKGAMVIGHGWRMGPESRWLRQTLSLAGTGFRRTADGTVETAILMPQLVIETKTGHRLTASATATYDDLERAFPLGDDVGVPAGEYTFVLGRLQFRQSVADLLRVDVTGDYGDYYDGRRGSASLTTTWNQSMHLELEARYQVDDVSFDARAQRFRSHLLRFRTEARIDTRLSAAALVQYASAGDLVSVNLRVRYNPREGDDLYLVWNEGIFTDRFSRTPVRPYSDRRQLVVKYSKTLTLGT